METEIYWSAPGHAVGRWRNVFVQVRSGELTLDAMRANEMGARLTRAQYTRSERLGALMVLEKGAPLAKGEVAVLQRKLLATLAEEPRICVCVVLEGDGVALVAQRAFARVAIGNKQRKVCQTLREGAAWVLATAGVPDAGGSLVAFVESIRPKG
jgi:hypothetical protein